MREREEGGREDGMRECHTLLTVSLSLPPRTLHVSFQVSANGQVLQSEILGNVKMNVKLTGMPELRLGLNDKVLFESTGSKLEGNLMHSVCIYVFVFLWVSFFVV